MTDDIHWLTYEEAAARLGVDPDSVKRRAQRQGWERRQGNDPRDRRVRIGVPADVLPRDDTSPDVAPEPMAALMERTIDRAIAAEARAAAAEARVEILERERRRLVKGLPTWQTQVVVRRLHKMAKGRRQ